MAIDGVSIIISAYKASEFIEECLDSILGQSTSIRYEVILGVDGCKDTLDKIKSILQCILSITRECPSNTLINI